MDRYEATGRDHNGCDHCDGMGCAPVRQNHGDPKWRAAWEKAKPRRVPLFTRVKRRLLSLHYGRVWLRFVRRQDGTRIAKCPYCRGPS